MSDELKPCPFCGSEYTQVRWIGFTHTHNGAFTAGYRGECCDCWATTRAFNNEADAAKVWNARADDAQVIENAENYKLADDSEPQVIATSEKYEQADSREQLEADIQLSAMHLEFDDGYRSVEKVLDMVPLSTVYTWLDRQAAITRAEVFEDGEFDCLTCDAKVELCGEIDSLTAERDELREELEDEKFENGWVRDFLNRMGQKCGTADCPSLVAYVNNLETERDELRVECDKVDSLEEEAESHKRTANRLHNEVEYLAGQLAELTAERDELSHAVDKLRRRVDGMFCLNDLVDKNNARLEAERDSLRKQLAEKQRVCDVQRDSFLKMERELAEANERIGELERTIENMRGD